LSPRKLFLFGNKRVFDDDELPLSCLVNIRNTLGEIGVTLEEVVAVDNNVVVTETRSADDIVNSLLNKDTDGENSESDDDPVLNDIPTNADGLLALDTVRRIDIANFVIT
jgi:hypothetical protein